MISNPPLLLLFWIAGLHWCKGRDEDIGGNKILAYQSLDLQYSNCCIAGPQARCLPSAAEAVSTFPSKMDISKPYQGPCCFYARR
jgi:hypothetical protein